MQEVQIKEDNKSEEGKSLVFSQAWPSFAEVQKQADVHTKLKLYADKIDVRKIIYKELSEESLQEVQKLHREWFPVNYDRKFFERIFRNNVIALGCFYRIPLND